MNVRRGVVMAGLHFAVAVGLIGWHVSREWNSQHGRLAPVTAHLTHTAWQEEPSEVPFDPCHGKGYADYFTTPQELTVIGDNLPAWAITGWMVPCPAPWTLAGLIGSGSMGSPLRQYLLVSAGLCALIPVQWFFVAAFPLMRLRRRFLEPGALITSCTLISVALILMTRMLPISEVVEEVSGVLMLVTFLLWSWWMVLLVWRGVSRLFRRTGRAN